jgi:hypothetical protein
MDCGAKLPRNFDRERRRVADDDASGRADLESVRRDDVRARRIDARCDVVRVAAGHDRDDDALHLRRVVEERSRGAIELHLGWVVADRRKRAVEVEGEQCRAFGHPAATSPRPPDGRGATRNGQNLALCCRTSRMSVSSFADQS